MGNFKVANNVFFISGMSNSLQFYNTRRTLRGFVPVDSSTRRDKCVHSILKLAVVVHVDGVRMRLTSRGLIRKMMHVSTDLYCIDNYRGKPKNLDTKLFQWHYVHQKSHKDWPGRESGPPGERPATNCMITFSSYVVGYINCFELSNNEVR
jgi:hypothetical protein